MSTTPSTTTTTIGVIGTTGRDKSRPLTNKHFDFMVDAFNQYLEKLIVDNKLDRNNITLVSGGAAWCDHLAVDYFLKNSNNCKLILYLPCPIVESVSTSGNGNGGEVLYKFEEKTGDVHWSLNPGKSTNNYHSNFSKQIGRNTINEIIEAQKLGAIIDTKAHGFKDRNTCISKSQYLVALTGAIGAAPLGGGTLDTWKKSTSPLKNKFHITIPESFTPIKQILEQQPKKETHQTTTATPTTTTKTPTTTTKKTILTPTDDDFPALGSSKKIKK